MTGNSNAIERLLCCNVLTSDEYSQPDVFRHPFYTYDGPITWPPLHWEKGRCLYCAQSFHHTDKTGKQQPVPPVPFPCFHDKRTGQWRVSGMYCSWNCVKAELLHTHGYACGEGCLLIEQLARKIFKYTGPDIAPAPPKGRLSFFYPGPDTLTIDEFRQESAVSFTSVITPPLLSSPEVYERHAYPIDRNPWTVKGIRAKGFSTATSSTTFPEMEPTQNIDDKSSMFQDFMQQKEAEHEDIEDNISIIEVDNCAGGTLMDWRDPKVSATSQKKTKGKN